MKNKNFWLSESKTTITNTKHILADLSVKVRTDQFRLFVKILHPNKHTKVLDVGVTSDETLKDSNIFERLYKWQKNLTTATIEDPKEFKKLYPKVNVVKVTPGRKLPFRDSYFDIVVAWATLEHTGNYKDQNKFLNELLRVGKKVFITTPYRGAFYEPHSGLFFIHWLPLQIFRKVCELIGKKHWADIKNLNPLWVEDIKKMKLRRDVSIILYKTFKFLPSHIIIAG